MARTSRYQKRESDRSGFDSKRISLIKDGPYLVTSDEYDQPPPSKKSLGGEGDIARGDSRSNWEFTVDNTAIPSSLDNPTQYVTAAGGITYTNAHPWIKVAGSNSTVNITANPQISAGREASIVAIQCVGSSVILEHGSGLSLLASQAFTMTSGSVITFIYNTGGNLWQETSRTREY